MTGRELILLLEKAVDKPILCKGTLSGGTGMEVLRVVETKTSWYIIFNEDGT